MPVATGHIVPFGVRAPPLVAGWCDPAFGRVRDAFAENFADGLEVGAALAVTVDGVPVVDLWGGWAHEELQVPWDRDTVVCLFSCSKGLLALVALRLVDEGQLDLDQPVSRYWPEFAANGKD